MNPDWLPEVYKRYSKWYGWPEFQLFHRFWSFPRLPWREGWSTRARTPGELCSIVGRTKILCNFLFWILSKWILWHRRISLRRSTAVRLFRSSSTFLSFFSGIFGLIRTRLFWQLRYLCIRGWKLRVLRRRLLYRNFIIFLPRISFSSTKWEVWRYRRYQFRGYRILYWFWFWDRPLFF